jgi:hypothetical protein
MNQHNRVEQAMEKDCIGHGHGQNFPHARDLNWSIPVCYDAPVMRVVDKAKVKQSEQIADVKLLHAIDTITRAIEEHTQTIRLHERNQSMQQLASDFRQLGHLTFGGLVIAQLLTDTVDQTIAWFGVVVLLLLYFIANTLTKGGDTV